jgi:hypothetical protein
LSVTKPSPSQALPVAIEAEHQKCPEWQNFYFFAEQTKRVKLITSFVDNFILL